MRGNDLETFYTVELCQRVTIGDVLKAHKKSIKESELNILGTRITLSTSKTGGDGTRYWLTCPICGTRRGVLYKHPLHNVVCCRVCLGIHYEKQRYKGMVEKGGLPE